MKNLKTIRIAIVWANPFSTNLGVGALAYSALSILGEVIRENNLKASIILIGSSGAAQEKLVINNAECNFKTIKGLDFLRVKSLVKLILLPKRFNTIEILRSQIIFDIAEGDSFSDIYGNQRFRKILNSKRLFRFLGKKQVLLPQTIGPFKEKKNERDAFGVMTNMVKVIARDRQSSTYCSHFLPSEQVMESIDVAFFLPYQKMKFDDRKIHVGVNVSGLLWNGGYTRDNQFGLKADYKKLMLDIIAHFKSIPKVQLHLVSHVLPENGSVEDDYAVAIELNRLHPETILPHRFKTPVDAKSYISGLDFFTGARMHACIAAFSSMVPVVPIAYSRKFNGLFGDTLGYEHIGDCVNEAEDDILGRVKQAFVNRDVLKDTICDSLNEVVAPKHLELKQMLLQTMTNE